jgi:hypothetical protein
MHNFVNEADLPTSFSSSRRKAMTETLSKREFIINSKDEINDSQQDEALDSLELLFTPLQANDPVEQLVRRT